MQSTEELALSAERLLRRVYRHKLKESGPEWFDHRIDLFLWAEKRVPFWVERGVFARAIMSEGDNVLDLCCGDGFYSYYFYSRTAAHIFAVDRDESAVEHARKWHGLANIAYRQLDIITHFPQGHYDVIVWDAAIEHFNLHEIRMILYKCYNRLLKNNGVLCGYTIIPTAGWATPNAHKHEFGSAEELRALLLETFPFAATFETIYPSRHNLYFRAGFDPEQLAGFSVEKRP